MPILLKFAVFVFRQLSSLSQHAEDMFRELFVEATTIFERTCNLSNKVDSLRDSVQQFDPNQVVGECFIIACQSCNTHFDATV